MKIFKTPEDEVDSWKLKVYHKTKNMTSEQRADYYGKSLDRRLEKSGYKLVPVAGQNYSRLVKINETTPV